MKSQISKISYVNIAKQNAPIKSELLRAIERVIDHGQFVLGKEVEELEKRFSEMCGARFSVAVNSGTDALILSLRALHIGAGDEVITVSNSFVATASSIYLAGATPVFVDIRDDLNIDPGLIEQAITRKTKAILPVHLTGRPADMNTLMSIAKKHKLHVIEDCAQAVLAEYSGKRVGSFGTVGCFSLHPLKTLNACGDGGMMTTNDEALYGELKLLRNLGLKTRDECVVWSNNSRLDTVQAACVLVKMNYVEQWTEKRREHAQYYQQHLSSVKQVKCPLDQPSERSVYHTFVIQAQQRDRLKQYLLEKGIETAVHYPIPIHLQPAYQKLGVASPDCPRTEKLANLILSLPIYPELDASDLNYICETIKEFYEANRC